MHAINNYQFPQAGSQTTPAMHVRPFSNKHFKQALQLLCKTAANMPSTTLTTSL
jgi:hypothetical protein